ncbi:hypothetical protein TrRE_jg5087, partial [Triparma retinervis]
MLPTDTAVPHPSAPQPSSSLPAPSDPTKISVISWELRGDGPSKHTAYTLYLPPSYRSTSTSTTDSTTDTAVIRYSWIEALRRSLISEFELITVPPLDSKKAIGNTAAPVVKKRVAIINSFLNFCQTVPAIDACHVWRNVFLMGLKPGDESATLEPWVPPSDRAPTSSAAASAAAKGWLQGVGQGVSAMIGKVRSRPVPKGPERAEKSKPGRGENYIGPLPDTLSPTANVRRTARDIMSNAKHVTLDVPKLLQIPSQSKGGPSVSETDWNEGGLHFLSPTSPENTALYVLVLDSMNFCFWPSKSSSLQYHHLATAFKTLAEASESKGSAGFRFSPARLSAIDEAFFTSEVHPLLPPSVTVPSIPERVHLLRELGDGLLHRHSGSATSMLSSAGRSADRLVDIITRDFPAFRDEAVDLDGRRRCFYKRAQIATADLWSALGRKGDADFEDIGLLTTFADYRVPQVLRHYGGLKYSKELAKIVDGKTVLPAGCRMEMEIRAATIVAVDEMAREGGVTAVEMDWHLSHSSYAPLLHVASSFTALAAHGPRTLRRNEDSDFRRRELLRLIGIRLGSPGSLHKLHDTASLRLCVAVVLAIEEHNACLPHGTEGGRGIEKGEAEVARIGGIGEKILRDLGGRIRDVLRTGGGRGMGMEPLNPNTTNKAKK